MHFDLSALEPQHAKLTSIRHLLEQPSLLIRLPSSHWLVYLLPSPHLSIHSPFDTQYPSLQMHLLFIGIFQKFNLVLQLAQRNTLPTFLATTQPTIFVQVLLIQKYPCMQTQVPSTNVQKLVLSQAVHRFASQGLELFTFRHPESAVQPPSTGLPFRQYMHVLSSLQLQQSSRHRTHSIR